MFVSDLVGSPEDSFSCDMAQIGQDKVGSVDQEWDDGKSLVPASLCIHTLLLF